jgi:peptidoglycan/LPS O-acetylase OafA/YrhL
MEMMFYAIFFISFRISHKNRGLIASIVVCAFVVVGGFVKTGTVFDQWTSPVFLEFAMGIMAYTLLKQGGFVRGELPKKNLRIFAGILSLAALASLFVYDLVVTPSYQEITPIRPAAYGVLSMICFMGCYVALLGMRLPRPLVGVGNISYSLYLTHIFVILFTNYVVYPDGAQYPFAIPVLLFNVVLSLLVAYASWKIIETKWGNYLSSKFLSRPSPFLSV